MWDKLGKIALQAGKSYWDKKGFKGVIDDFNKIKEQFSTSNSNYDVEDEFDEFEMAYEEAIENDNLDIALSLVEDLYSNIAKDHLYYYFIANAYFNALHIDRKNFEKAIHNFKIAYSKAPNGSEAQVHYKERYTDLQEIYVDIQKYDELRAKIEKLCDNKEFFLAKEALDKYYDNKGSDYKKNSASYWEQTFWIDFKKNQYLHDELKNWDFDVLRKDLNELKKCSRSKDSYFEEEDTLKEYESFRDCEIFRLQHKYKDAVDAVNLYYMDHNQKDSELFTYWEEDFYYWRRIYGNYVEALKNGFLIGKSYNEDLSVIENALYNMKKYSDDEIDNETLTTCLKEFEDFKINISNNNFHNITGNINKNPNYNPSALNEKEKEYLTEYKECAIDGELSSTELRLLDKIRQSLGISVERAKEIENQYSLNFLNKEEKEFADEIKEILKDGVITDKERRLLNKLAKSLNISPERASDIETIIAKK